MDTTPISITNADFAASLRVLRMMIEGYRDRQSRQESGSANTSPTVGVLAHECESFRERLLLSVEAGDVRIVG